MKKIGKNVSIYLIIFILVVIAATVYDTVGLGNKDKVTVSEVPYSQLVNYVKNEKISEIVIEGTKLTGTLTKTKKVFAYAPSITQIDRLDSKYMSDQIEKGVLKYSSPAPKTTSWLVSAIPTILMIIVMVFIFWYITNQGGNGKAFSFGKSKARMFKGNGKQISFDDVAGLDEEKAELEEVVDFLKDPRKYRELGARIPKGILLVGPPGTGKTYISKATAGEAGVPFFSISGSDFVEMFVGVGASRVRDLFEQAKKNSPCIIFIDEIDAVGRKRGAGIGGGHDEREQTLNQLLVEMDGFGENSGIIILAATNRPDILDPALLRPGRFDRQVVIGIPDIKGREAIFKIHSKNKPLSKEVSPEVLAKRTPGFTPADIENLLNEAALITARRNGRFIRMDEIEEAITKVIVGPAKKSRVMNEEERKLTALHEGGHAVASRVLPGCDPVHQITIIPRGRAGGFTMYLPKEDRTYDTKKQMLDELVSMLAGRAAEELTLDDISTGASSDIQRATDIARDMVTKYGFSDRIGTVNYADSEEVFLGNDFSSKKNFSEDTAKEIDEEVRGILDTAYARAKEILTDNMEILKRVAKALLEVETLDGDQFEKLFTGEWNAEDIVDEVSKNAEERKSAELAEAEEAERLRKEEEERLAVELAKFDEDYLSEEADAEGESVDEEVEESKDTAKEDAEDKKDQE